MQTPPKTLEEASAYRYNKWGGNPKGYSYDPKCCAYERWTGGRGSLPVQCNRKHGHGPDGLYCKQHAEMTFPTKPKVEKPRKLTLFESLWKRCNDAEARAESLEAENKKLRELLQPFADFIALMDENVHKGPDSSPMNAPTTAWHLRQIQQALGESGVGA